MAPIRPDHYSFAFQPETLEELRKQLGLTQAALAELLEIPVNTVSRWERGANTPDANALAAIFSIAKDSGITPQFFTRRAGLMETQNQRTKLLFPWDFQNRGLDASEVETEWPYMRKYIDLLFPRSRASRQFWAYTAPHQYQAAAKLEQLKFEVYTSHFDADSQLVQDVKEECQKRPTRTILILAADDGNYAELLRTEREAGVDVYIWGTDRCSDRLRRTLADGHFIHWDAPFVVTECVEVIKKLRGKSITRSEFGIRCKERLDDSEIYPYDAGFSSNHPYSSLLRWLERQGIVVVRKASGKQDAISITLK